MSVRVLKHFEFDRPLAEELCRLWLEIWPRKDVSEVRDYATKLLAGEVINQVRVPGSQRFHLLESGGELLAACLTFEREICFLESGTRKTVLGLAGVCTSPRRRGCGYGKKLVENALERLGGDIEICLFQTGVPGFYQRFGAYFVENQFVNSLNVDDPEANPWWDKCTMAIGGREKWPTGRVDLLGAAY